MNVYDETWKEAMDKWLEAFVAFFFPRVHADIDWSRGWESLDAELREVVLAHLETLARPDDDASRFARKRQVMRGLYERGMPKQMVLELLRLVDWMMSLPIALESLFRQEHQQWEEKKQMPYVTSFERLARAEGQAEGRAEGLQEGLLEAIELGLKLRFGTEGLQCLAAIPPRADIVLLRQIKQAIEAAAPLDDIRRLLPQ